MKKIIFEITATKNALNIEIDPKGTLEEKSKESASHHVRSVGRHVPPFPRRGGSVGPNRFGGRPNHGGKARSAVGPKRLGGQKGLGPAGRAAAENFLEQQCIFSIFH